MKKKNANSNSFAVLQFADMSASFELSTRLRPPTFNFVIRRKMGFLINCDLQARLIISRDFSLRDSIKIFRSYRAKTAFNKIDKSEPGLQSTEIHLLF